jgi:hypothetical protein
VTTFEPELFDSLDSVIAFAGSALAATVCVPFPCVSHTTETRAVAPGSIDAIR